MHNFSHCGPCIFSWYMSTGKCTYMYKQIIILGLWVILVCHSYVLKFLSYFLQRVQKAKNLTNVWHLLQDLRENWVYQRLFYLLVKVSNLINQYSRIDICEMQHVLYLFVAHFIRNIWTYSGCAPWCHSKCHKYLLFCPPPWQSHRGGGGGHRNPGPPSITKLVSAITSDCMHRFT